LTNPAIVFQIFQLREHASATRNNAADTNETIQVYLSAWEWISECNQKVGVI